jgi:hypothetical protein
MKQAGPGGGKKYDVDGPGYNPVDDIDIAQNF